MKAYKGFNVNKQGDLGCLGFIYEEGKTYTLSKGEDPSLCIRGFHACLNPIDVFYYYYTKPWADVEFHEVDLDKVSKEHSTDSKIVAGKITIGKKLTVDEMFTIGVKMILENPEEWFDDNGLARVRKDNKLNFLKSDGSLLLEEWYDHITPFNEGFARVGRTIQEYLLPDRYHPYINTIREYNYIDIKGNLLLNDWCSFCEAFSNGYATIETKTKRLLQINIHGEEI